MGPGVRVTSDAVGLFVGLTTLDLVHRVDGPVQSNTKVTAMRQDLAAGGPAANAAVTFVALGGRATLVTALGEGVAARAAAADLEEHGVNVVDVAPRGFDVAVSAVAVDERTGERTVVSPDAGRLPVAPPDAGDLAELVAAADVLLLDGHHPALQEAAARAAQCAGVPVVLDAGRWKPHLASLLGRCDVVVASADFRLGPAERPGDMRDGQGDATDRTVNRAAAVGPGLVAGGISRVAITHGADPVVWWEALGAPGEARQGSVPVPQVRAVDTLGAGDAFHGALALALARGEDFPVALAAASAVAAHRVSVVGPRAWLDTVRGVSGVGAFFTAHADPFGGAVDAGRVP